LSEYSFQHVTTRCCLVKRNLQVGRGIFLVWIEPIKHKRTTSLLADSTPYCYSMSNPTRRQAVRRWAAGTKCPARGKITGLERCYEYVLLSLKGLPALQSTLWSLLSMVNRPLSPNPTPSIPSSQLNRPTAPSTSEDAPLSRS
jgi:hypothetical protein